MSEYTNEISTNKPLLRLLREATVLNSKIVINDATIGQESLLRYPTYRQQNCQINQSVTPHKRRYTGEQEE